MRQCVACFKNITIGELIECSKCKGKFHFTCVNISKSHFVSHKHDLERTWSCPECERITKQLPRNDLTPIRPINGASAPTGSDINLHEPTNTDIPCNATQCTSSVLILQEIRELKGYVMEQFMKQETRFSDLAQSIDQLNLNVTDLTNKYSSLRTDVNNVFKTVDTITEEQLLLRAKCDENSRVIKDLKTISLSLEQKLISNTHSILIPCSEGISPENYSCRETQESSKANAVPSPKPTSSPVRKNKKKKNIPITDSSSGKTLRCEASKQNIISEVATVSPPSHERNIADEDESDWQVYTTKKRGNTLKSAVVKGSGQKHELLETVERTRKIHACFFKPETTPEVIEEYMRKFCDSSIKVEKMKLKHSFYSSFILCVPESKFKVFMAPETWPEGTQVSEWFRRAGRATRDHPNHTSGQRKS